MKARGPALESLYDGLHTPCPTRLTLYVSSGSGDPVDSAVEMSDVSVLSGTVISNLKY
jgi:hypothetical protein